jgi:transmembrane sensor
LVRLFGNAEARIEEEAALWVARLRGPDADSHSAAFEAWCRADPANVPAFDEAAAAFEAAGALRLTAAGRRRSVPHRSASRSRPFGYAVAALVVASALLAFVLLANRRPQGPEPAQVEWAAAPLQAREVALPDGSRLHLGAASEASGSFTGSERRIRLRFGRARFTVARDGRTFVVLAGHTRVVARGTVFEVQLRGGTAKVRLIEGVVDVADVREGVPRRVVRLSAGQAVTVPQAEAAARQRDAVLARSEAAMLEFDDVRLDDAVAAANRAALRKVRLGDPSLARLRVTGAFRSGDAVGLARSLAAMFRLKIETGPAGELILLPPENTD